MLHFIYKQFFCSRSLHLVLIAVAVIGCRGKIDPREGRPVPTIPLPPTNVSITNADGFSALNWSAASYATSYNVYWSTAAGVTKSSNKISSVLPPFSFTGLTNGQTIYFAVSSSGKLGEGNLSSESSMLPVNGAGTTDTFFADQWHLSNTGQAGGTAGEDINVATAWSTCGVAATCRGEGVRIAVVDDGLDILHEDIFANIAPKLSYNYVTLTTDPSYSSLTEGHGHAVGGIIAARDLNDVGVRGVAPRANLVGYNVLQNLTLSTEADSMIRNASSVSVSSNSWGAVDSTGDTEASSATWKAAINTGLTIGRGGLGTIYAWAAGNGDGGSASPAVRDNANLDGRANYRGVMAIGALLDNGQKTTYSERGANLWVSAPGGGSSCASGHLITTTDRTGTAGFNANGTNDLANVSYTKCMNGTSAATPIVSGVVALVLQAKPTLGWRDVKKILATTAEKNHAAQAEWDTNGAGLNINPNFGFGRVDANAAVTAALAYGANLGAEETLETAFANPGLAIPDNDAVTGVSSNIVVAASGITQIEFIEVTFTAADHAAMEDLEVTLTNTSTAGSAESVLTETHTCIDTACAAFNGWVFGDAMHLNEPADGTWRLTVKDKRAGNTGTFQAWKLKFYGT